MITLRNTNNGWEVGNWYGSTYCNWNMIVCIDNFKEALQLVHYLNGGNSNDSIPIHI